MASFQIVQDYSRHIKWVIIAFKEIFLSFKIAKTLRFRSVNNSVGTCKMGVDSSRGAVKPTSETWEADKSIIFVIRYILFLSRANTPY